MGHPILRRTAGARVECASKDADKQSHRLQMTIHDADSHSSPGGGMSTASSFGHGIRSSPADTTPVESTILASLPPPALCGLAPRSSRAGPQGRSHPVPRADTEPGEPVPPSNQRGIILKQRQHVGEGTAAARSDKSIVVRSDGPGSHETLPAQRPPAARQPCKWSNCFLRY